MANNPIDCIIKHAKHLSTDENISREAATDLALKEFEKLHGELEDFKASISPNPKKYVRAKFVSPDKSKEINAINEKYNPLIEEAGKVDEPKPTEENKPDEKKSGLQEEKEAGNGTTPKPPAGEKPRIRTTGKVIPVQVVLTDDDGEKLSLTHEETENLYEEMGLGERVEREGKKDETLIKQADKLIADGYDFDKVSRQVFAKEHTLNDAEQVAFAKAVAALKAKQKNVEPFSEEFNRLQDKIERYARASDVSGSESGAQLRARQIYVPVEDTISDYIMYVKEELGVSTLTDQQEKDINNDWTKYNDARQKFEEWRAKKEKELTDREAVLTVEEMKKKSGKKTTKDLAAERTQIINDILLKFSKLGDKDGASFLGAEKLAAIAPDVLKLARNIVESGAVKLAEVSKKVYDLLSDKMPDLELSDINKIMAGRYEKVKPTKTQLTETWRDLREEARLIDKLESLENGEEPKNETNKIARNKEITDLRSKIKENDLNQLSKAKTRIKSEIAKIEEQLKNNDFSKPEKKEIKWDDEGRKLQKDLLEARKKKDISVLKQKYALRSRKEKVMSSVAEIFNIPRSLMASTDFSAPLNQGFIATTSYPKEAKEALKFMFQATKSQQAFDEWFYDIAETPQYDLYKNKLKLRISDPHSPYLTAREEQFMSGYAEQLPALNIGGQNISNVYNKTAGALVKASERAYVGYLNKMRWDLMNRFVAKFEDDGKTYNNSKDLYEKTAKYINNITGAGHLGKLDQFSPLFSALLFSPRLMASRLNLLNPLYGAGLPKELRGQYYRDMGQSFGLGGVVLGLTKIASLAFKGDDDDEDKIQVEGDPRSSDFGKIRQGKTRWNIWGGFQPYFRLATQEVLGQRKSSNTGMIQSLSGEGAFGQSRGDVLTSFVRGKLAPVPSMIWNLTSGRNIVGEKVTLGDELLSHITPLTIGATIEGWKEYGAISLLNVAVPSAFGVGTQVYNPKTKEIKDEEVKYTVKKDGDTVQLKAKLTDAQQKDYNQKATKYVEDAVKKLKSIPEYKELGIDEQVKIKSTVENRAVKKAEKEIVAKYGKTFPGETKEEEQKRKELKVAKEKIEKELIKKLNLKK